MAFEVHKSMRLFLLFLSTLLMSAAAKAVGQACTDFLIEARTTVSDRSFRQFGQGTAFSAGNHRYVLTPAHVIQGAEVIQGRCLEAGSASVTFKLVQSSILGDLAVLSAEGSAPALKPLFDINNSQEACTADKQGLSFEVTLSFLKPSAGAVSREDVKLPYAMFVPRHVDQPLIGYKSGLLLGNLAVRPGWSGARVTDSRGRFCGLIVKSSRRFAYSYGIPGHEVQLALKNLLRGRESVAGNFQELSLFALSPQKDRLARLRVLQTAKNFYMETHASSEFSPVSAWSVGSAGPVVSGVPLQALASEADQLKAVTGLLKKKSREPVVFAGKGDWGDGGGDLANADADHRRLDREVKTEGVFRSKELAYLESRAGAGGAEGLLTADGRRLIALRPIYQSEARALGLKNWSDYLRDERPSDGSRILGDWKDARSPYLYMIRLNSIEQIYQIHEDFKGRGDDVIKRFGVFEDEGRTIREYCRSFDGEPGTFLSFNQADGHLSMEPVEREGLPLYVMNGVIPMGLTSYGSDPQAMKPANERKHNEPDWMGLSCKDTNDTLTLRLFALPYVKPEKRQVPALENFFLAADLEVKDHSLKGTLQVGDCRQSLDVTSRKGWSTPVENQDVSLTLQINEDSKRMFTIQFHRVAPRCFESLLKRHPVLRNKNYDASQMWLRRFEWVH